MGVGGHIAAVGVCRGEFFADDLANLMEEPVIGLGGVFSARSILFWCFSSMRPVAL